MSSPNYEMPMDADTNNVYMVTVNGTDSTDGTNTDAEEVTVTVTNVDEAGTVTLIPPSPMVDTAVTAALTDPDGTTTNISWVWLMSLDDGEYTAIPGATTEMYTPTAEDATNYIKARAMYDDPEGANKVADSDPAMVTAANPLLIKYDGSDNGGNDNGKIDIEEISKAFTDYIGGRISIGEMSEIFTLYIQNIQTG